MVTTNEQLLRAIQTLSALISAIPKEEWQPHSQYPPGRIFLSKEFEKGEITLGADFNPENGLTFQVHTSDV